MRRIGALSWFGLFAAPLAWAVQHVAGVATTIARCGDLYHPHRSVGMDAAVVALSAATLLLALAGEAAAVTAWRRTRGAGEEAPPSRIHFVSVMGMTFSPLFAVLIVMSALGALILPECLQS